MTEQEKKDFVTSIRKELIEEEHLYLGEEFADDTSEFMVEALEKQIPKDPITVHEINGYKESWFIGCPSCKKETSYSYAHGNTEPKYCLNCGQRLEWRK